jgi:hypothetical protein
MKAVVWLGIVTAAAWSWYQAVPAAQYRGDAARVFDGISSVLSSPRCANCHITGDTPLQGDDAHPHAMRVRRGTDGRGTPAMRCSTCHQEASSVTPHAPPGAPDWHLPPAATPMAWKGLTPGDQCRMLKDPARNGHRTLADLLAHAARDPIVVASWSPGPERPLPPMSHEAFVAHFTRWIELGAVCPE